MKIRRLISEMSKTVFVLIICSIPAVRAESSEPVVPKVNLLIADFNCDKESRDLAVHLKPVLHKTLQQSDRLAIYPELKIKDFLIQKFRDPKVDFSLPLALEISLKEDIPVILLPGIDRLNDSIIISARLFHVNEKNEVFVDTIRLNNENFLPATIEELSRRIRRHLGEIVGSPTLSGFIFKPATTVETMNLFSESFSFYEHKSRRESMARLQEVLAIDPDMMAAQLNLGMHYLRLRQTPKALPYIMNVKGHSEDLPLKDRYLIYGISNVLSHRYIAARNQFRSLADAFPYDWQANYHLAWCSMILGDYSRAIEEYRKSITLDDTQIESYLGLCLALLSNGDAQEANRVYKQAALLLPTDPEVTITLGLLELLDNNPRFAIEEFERSKQSSLYRSYSMFLQAQAKIYEGKFQDALQLLALGIDEDINNLDKAGEYSKRLSRARILLLQGKTSAAVNECRTILNIAEDPLSLAHLGYVFAEAGDVDSARKILPQLRAIENSPFVRSLGDHLQGKIHSADGRLKDAARFFLRSKEYSGTPSIDLARTLAQLERWKEASAEYAQIRDQKAALLFPFYQPWYTGTWVQAIYDAGRCNLKAGHPAEAKQYFRQYLWIMESADSDIKTVSEAEFLLTGRSSKSE